MYEYVHIKALSSKCIYPSSWYDGIIYIYTSCKKLELSPPINSFLDAVGTQLIHNSWYGFSLLFYVQPAFLSTISTFSVGELSQMVGRDPDLLTPEI